MTTRSSSPTKSFMGLFFSEDGFSTVGVALALLITLSMVFVAAQVHQINSAAAEIQEVADAAALAAEGQVAQFYVAAQLCDAALLSMGLAALVILGVGVVCLCIPTTQGVGGSLIDAGKKILSARSDFRDSAAQALTTLQKALPFIAALSAANVANANGSPKFRTSYFGMAVLVPIQGQDLAIGGFSKADSAMADVDQSKDALSDAGERAEELAREAEEERMRAFMADCGSNPNYCMYERAKRLAKLPDDQNPLYRSVDAWGFAAAFNRAKHYYAARYRKEAPASNSVNERANSALRKRFYAYAMEQMSKGYVHENATGTFDAFFPLMPKNTSEMKETHLYTDAVYPISQEESGPVMHAFSGCPGIHGGVTGRGSLAYRDAAGMSVCPRCDFQATSMGKVAAASTAISNGFEYHYNIVAKAAKAYQEKREAYAREAAKVKNAATDLLSQIAAAMREAGQTRIHAMPPGRYGAVAIVATTDSMASSTNFQSSFVRGSGSLGTRAALSAATLVPENSDGGQNLITTLLDGYLSRATWGVGSAVAAMMDIWGSVLEAYSNGQRGLQEAIAKACGGIRLTSASHLGTWASAKFAELVQSVGLEPADVQAWKPVTVNSYHVLAADASGSSAAFSGRLLATKSFASSLSGNDVFASAVNGVERQALQSIQGLREGYTLASINFTGKDGQEIPIVVTLPAWAVAVSQNAAMGIADRLRGLVGSMTGARQWQ